MLEPGHGINMHTVLPRFLGEQLAAELDWERLADAIHTCKYVVVC